MRAASLLSALPLALVACQPDTVAPLFLEASLEVSPSAIDFGETPLHVATSHSVRLDNVGPLFLEIHAEVVEELGGAFAASPAVVPLAVGQSAAIDVTFAPTELGTHVAELRVVDPAHPDEAVVVNLRGEGNLPQCDDDNDCTDDEYDPEGASCRHTQRRGPCDDGTVCTENDRCFRGVCAGEPVVCDDGVACTVDSCDDVRGCTYLPDHRRCGAVDACTQGICRVDQGCGIEVAPDGSPCGEVSCAEMAICIQGECRTGPTPDGVACDDGDPCTTGDACLQGACVPGEGHGGLVTEPVEFAFHNVPSVYWPRDPAAVLAVNVPRGGGLDVVWVDDPPHATMTFTVLRTRLDAAGALVATGTLAIAEQARATFVSDDLLLLVAGCENCLSYSRCSSDDVGPCVAPCHFELRRVAADGGDVRATCLDRFEVWPETIDLAADDLATYVVELAMELGPSSAYHAGQVWVRAFDDHLEEMTGSGLQYFDDRAHISGNPYPRDLNLAVWNEAAFLTYRRAEVGEPMSWCGYCSHHGDSCFCDDEGSCLATYPMSVVEGPLFIVTESDWVEGFPPLQPYSLGLATAPAPARGFVVWGEDYVESENDSFAPVCALEEEVQILTPSPSTGVYALERAEAVRSPSGQIADVHAAALHGATVALVQRWTGGLTLYRPDADGALVASEVPAPLPHREVRRFAVPRRDVTRFPSLAVASVADGFVAVGITQLNGYTPEIQTDTGDEEADEPRGDPAELPIPDGLAYFTVGCGISLAPRP